MSDFEPQQTRWIWPNRLPLGSLAILEGLPEAGKTTLFCDIVARITTGRAMPDCRGGMSPQNVLIFEAEDSGSTVHNRLVSAGADMERVKIPETRATDHPIRFPTDISEVEACAAKHHVSLILIDPITAYAEGNLNNDQSARSILTPLAQMAERLSAAVVIIRHLTKTGSGSPLLRGAGSIGIAGAARSVLLVAESPSDPEQRIIASVKSNLCRPPASLAFQTIDVNGAVRINWLGTSQFTASDLVDGRGTDDNQETFEAVRVLYWLLETGPLPADEVIKLAGKNGVTESRLRKKAKKILGVNSKRKGFGPGSIVNWELPDGSELLQHLRDQDLSDLVDRLIYDDEPVKNHQDESGGDDEDGPDSADWWKSNEKDVDDEDDGTPSIPI